MRLAAKYQTEFKLYGNSPLTIRVVCDQGHPEKRRSIWIQRDIADRRGSRHNTIIKW
jgi:hypothetical protein